MIENERSAQRAATQLVRSSESEWHRGRWGKMSSSSKAPLVENVLSHVCHMLGTILH
jgi:hypothetical protein